MAIQARKRFIVAFIVALLLATFAVAASAQQVLIPSGCQGLTPADLDWWVRSCWMYLGRAPEHGMVIR